MTPQPFHRGEGPAPRPTDWNLPNALTVLRFLLVPVYAVLLFQDGGNEPWWRFWAWVVFALAAVTDGVDGKLARRRGEITNFGKVADPIADKALTGTAFIGLSLLGAVWWWVTVVILVREIGITVLRFVVIRHGVMPAGRGGKLKTMLQTLSLGALTFPLSVLPLGEVWLFVAYVLLGAALVMTVLSGVDYVFKAARLRETSERTKARRAARTAQREAQREARPRARRRRRGCRAPTVGRRPRPRPTRHPSRRPRTASDVVTDFAGGSAPSTPTPGATLVSRLTARGETLACAESLTAGLVAAAVADTPGASEVLLGGVVAYSADVKVALLDVPAELVARVGTVDARVAVAMAEGVRRRLGATWGVATTGVAGPGPSEGKPAGTVHLAVAGPSGTVTRALRLNGTRAEIRSAAVDEALRLAVEETGATQPTPAPPGDPRGTVGLSDVDGGPAARHTRPAT